MRMIGIDGRSCSTDPLLGWRGTLPKLRKSGQVLLSMEGSGVSRIKSAGRTGVSCIPHTQRLSCCVTVDRDGRVRDKESRFLSHCAFHSH